MNSPKPVPVAFALAAVAALAGHASAQVIGPDCISSSHNDVARNGVGAGGSITAYSIGSVTCNKGDMTMEAGPNSTIRPLVGQAMYRLKSYTAPGGGTYQRFESVGQGWCKWVGVPVNGSHTSCGTCVGGGGTGFMGINCADTYSSGFNGASGMARRTFINPTTGYLTGTRGGGTAETSINTRLQVPTADVTAQPAGTRFFVETVHLLPHDATWVRPGQVVAINAMNNASSQEVNINAGTANPTLLNGFNQQIPAIERWKLIDPSVTVVTADHDDTPNPNAAFPNTFIRSRFHIAAKVTDLGGGQWRYEYAIYNLNSDRAAGSFTIPLPAGASFTDYTFRHPLYHSGEAISNSPWTADRQNNKLTFATEKHVVNNSANAIRWGTMYNFGFTSNVAPASGLGIIELFKPGTLENISTPAIPVPSLPTCIADLNLDNNLTADDIIAYLNAFFGTNLTVADIASLGGATGPDGRLTADDLVVYLSAFFAGCPQ